MSGIGKIGWIDLTVPNAEEVRAFYEAVVGWRSEPCDMGGYSDHSMIPPGGSEPVAGICHARGVNAGLPAQWLMYVTVGDLDASMAETERRGGKCLTPVREMGPWGRMCIIQDPAGAVCAIIQPPA